MAPPGALDERLLQLDREWAALLQTIDEEKRTAFEEARRKLVELLHASSPAVEQPVASAAPAAATSAGPVSFSVCGDILRRSSRPQTIFFALAPPTHLWPMPFPAPPPSLPPHAHPCALEFPAIIRPP